MKNQCNNIKMAKLIQAWFHRWANRSPETIRSKSRSSFEHFQSHTPWGTSRCVMHETLWNNSKWSFGLEECHWTTATVRSPKTREQEIWWNKLLLCSSSSRYCSRRASCIRTIQSTWLQQCGPCEEWSRCRRATTMPQPTLRDPDHQAGSSPTCRESPVGYIRT